MRSLIVAVGLYCGSTAEDGAGLAGFEGAGAAQALTKISKAPHNAAGKKILIKVHQFRIEMQPTA
jgi:hypothetical protein